MEVLLCTDKETEAWRRSVTCQGAQPAAVGAGSLHAESRSALPWGIGITRERFIQWRSRSKLEGKEPEVCVSAWAAHQNTLLVEKSSGAIYV